MIEENRIHCNSCENELAVTDGTIFQGTTKPLLFWFHIIWWIFAQETGGDYKLKDFMSGDLDEIVWNRLNEICGKIKTDNTSGGKLFQMIIKQAVLNVPETTNEILI